MLWYVCCFFQAPFRSKSIRVICIPWSSSSLYIWNLWLSGKHDRPLVPNIYELEDEGMEITRIAINFFSPILCAERFTRSLGQNQTIPPEDVSLSCYTVDVFGFAIIFTRKIMENSTPPPASQFTRENSWKMAWVPLGLEDGPSTLAASPTKETLETVVGKSCIVYLKNNGPVKLNVY